MMHHYDNFELCVFPYEKYLHRVINFSESYTFFTIDVTFLSGLALVVMGVAIIVVMVVLWENTESIQTQHVRIFLVLLSLDCDTFFTRAIQLFVGPSSWTIYHQCRLSFRCFLADHWKALK